MKPTIARCGTLLLPLVYATAAFGSGDAGSGHGEAHHEPSITGLIFPLINFLLYGFVIYRFAWPAISDYLLGRRAAVVSALDAAKQAQEEAEALKREYDSKFRNLAAEAEREKAEVLGRAETEARRILDAAKLSAERIRRDAQLVADQEVSRARAEIQAEAAQAIAELATDLIRSNLTSDDHQRFVADYVGELEKKPAHPERTTNQTRVSR